MNIRMFCLELDECCASHDRCGQATADRCVQARPTTADRLCCPRAMMACHARRRPTVYAVKGRRWHATPDVVRPCVLQKGEDGMPRQTPFDRVCPKAMMACHARRRSTVCAAQRRWWHATPDVVRPCVLPKGDDGMPRPTSFNCVCCPKAVMACHARHRSTVCAAQRRCWHATLDTVRPCVLPKGDDGMPRPTPSDRVCCPRVMMA